jgi:hypothetical protein
VVVRQSAMDALVSLSPLQIMNAVVPIKMNDDSYVYDRNTNYYHIQNILKVLH